jgi:Tfp pilus assembly protein PilV
MVAQRRTIKGKPQRGVTFVEVAVAVVVLSAAMVALAQLVTMAARQRRTSEHRRLALQEVANQAEHIALLNWNETAPDGLTTWQASADLLATLPGAVCRATVTDETGPPTSRRIRLTVTWTNAAGQQVEPLELTVWKFQPEAQP